MFKVLSRVILEMLNRKNSILINKLDLFNILPGLSIMTAKFFTHDIASKILLYMYNMLILWATCKYSIFLLTENKWVFICMLLIGVSRITRMVWGEENSSDGVWLEMGGSERHQLGGNHSMLHGGTWQMPCWHQWLSLLHHSTGGKV